MYIYIYVDTYESIKNHIHLSMMHKKRILYIFIHFNNCIKTDPERIEKEINTFIYTHMYVMMYIYPYNIHLQKLVSTHLIIDETRKKGWSA